MNKDYQLQQQHTKIQDYHSLFGSEFLGKRSLQYLLNPEYPVLNTKIQKNFYTFDGSEIVRKRVPGSEFLGKRMPHKKISGSSLSKI